MSDFTALGDAVNTTARLASEAAAGELLISVEAATAGGLDASSFERRTLSVRGRSDTIEVVALRVARDAWLGDTRQLAVPRSRT